MKRPPVSLTFVSLIVAIVGVFDAAVGKVWDLLVLFLVVGFVQLLVLVRSYTGRVTVTLRPDLARWTRQRSQRTGEPVTEVVDRAVAFFQHGLYRSRAGDGD